MLKKGLVYKATYDVHFTKKNTMIFSPMYDILVPMKGYKNDGFFVKNYSNIKCIFHINLADEICKMKSIGLTRLLKIERPSTKKDFDDIAKAMKETNFRYNKKFNKVEGYEST